MKKYFLLLSILFALQILIPDLLFTQDNRAAPIRITSGYIDKNPQFGSKIYSFYYSNVRFQNELCVFERYISNYSQICVLNFNNNSVTDSVQYLTTNNFIKRNPTVSYLYPFDAANKFALVMWESNENGKWDLFSKYYYRGVWQNIKPFDTSAGNKSNVSIYCFDSLKYAVTYEKNGDVIFKWYDALSNTVLYDTNLTANDTAYCSNPNFSVVPNSPYNSSKILVAYEKRKPNNETAIYYLKSSGNNNWTLPDTVAYAGDSKINEIKNNWGNYYISFDSKRGAYRKILTTYISVGTNYMNQNNPIDEQINNYNYSNLEWIPCNIITRGIIASAYAYVRKGIDGTKIFMNYNDLHWNFHDSTYIGDSSKTTRITMNNGINELGGTILTWLVYNKDSAGFSNLYAYKKSTYVTDIKQIEDLIPDKYSLEQNYPNPFNPMTKIRFSLPVRQNESVTYIVLKVYDVTGRETATLVNQNLKPGTYETTLNGDNLSSGIYFYTLFANGENINTKRMIFVK